MSKRIPLSKRSDISEILRGGEPKASKPAKQQASKTATEKVKATFYLEPADVELLEQERFNRRRKGDKADLSTLVRQAIRKAYGKR